MFIQDSLGVWVDSAELKRATAQKFENEKDLYSMSD